MGARSTALDPNLLERVMDAAAILKSAGAREVHLFGSAAEGRFFEGSDVDFAVSGLPPESFYMTLAKATDALGRTIDLVDLDVESPFIEYLKRKGKLRRVA